MKSDGRDGHTKEAIASSWWHHATTTCSHMCICVYLKGHSCSRVCMYVEGYKGQVCVCAAQGRHSVVCGVRDREAAFVHGNLQPCWGGLVCGAIRFLACLALAV